MLATVPRRWRVSRACPMQFCGGGGAGVDTCSPARMSLQTCTLCAHTTRRHTLDPHALDRTPPDSHGPFARPPMEIERAQGRSSHGPSSMKRTRSPSAEQSQTLCKAAWLSRGEPCTALDPLQGRPSTLSTTLNPPRLAVIDPHTLDHILDLRAGIHCTHTHFARTSESLCAHPCAHARVQAYTTYWTAHARVQV
jgi:hypothetical protein